MTQGPPAKAFLLAAGLGTRLKPYTDTVPKCLIPLGGEPLLHWWLVILERLGVREALLNTHHLPEPVRRFAAERRYSVKLTLSHEPRLLGSAGTLAANREFVAGERDFWIFYADTLIGADLSAMVPLHRTSGADLTLGLFQSPDPKSGGVVELGPGGEILSFEEKPARPRSDLVAAGAYLAGPALLARLPAGEGDLSRDVFPKLMRGARGLVLSPVIDIGTPERYEFAVKNWDTFGIKDRKPV